MPSGAGLQRRLVDLPNVTFMPRVPPTIAEVYRENTAPAGAVDLGGGLRSRGDRGAVLPDPGHRQLRGAACPSPSATGGICIADFQNAEAWLNEIRSLLADRMRYGELAERALAHATSDAFSTAKAAERFLAIASDPSNFGSASHSAVGSLLRRAGRFLSR